jgi:hypothetical protein
LAELENILAAATTPIAAAFLAVHAYGAHVCARVLQRIAGTPHEVSVRELMPDTRQDMVIIDLPSHPRYWSKARPSIFGYHPWNATVWLAIYRNRYTLPDDLVADAHLLRKLRWLELALLAGGFGLFALSIWTAWA